MPVHYKQPCAHSWVLACSAVKYNASWLEAVWQVRRDIASLQFLNTLSYLTLPMRGDPLKI